MSHNRGYRRDGRQNYQMNSSGHYGGRSGGQMNVNPWEGGMVPGRSGVAGLLPTPQTGLFSQLSNSAEAQLALASNLLSTILRPQQQPQVPSLLSLDSMGPMGGSGGMGYRGSGYGPGRYDDPGPNRRKRMDNRRAEPYNKSQQGRRNASARGGAERKTGGNQGLRSPSIGKGRSSVSKSGGKADKKDDENKKEKDVDEDKANDDEKNEEDSKR
ncbi:hypothetical protein C0J52_11139 [Blattella germanica]|nr:hypothetical protein C0J52_11139 [Blattella germanica]